jgi:murein L,D-transpeptidase YcbB/YkuD
LSSVLLLTGCGHDQRAVSAAIGHALTTSPASDAVVGAQLGHLYQQTENNPLWTTDRSLSGAARAVTLIKHAREHGLDPDWYGAADLERRITESTAKDATLPPEAVAALDVDVSIALLTMGRDVAIGRTDPTRITKSWKARRTLPDLAGTLAASSKDLDAWIRSIQPRHPEYERLRRALVAKLATPEAANEREEQRLALNLERWRWMPDDLGDRHLLINVPSFDLHVREHGADVITMRVVVGKPQGHETPIFSDVMESVVFSPYWNVPEGIALGETAPAAAKDPAYLERNNMELFRRTKRGNTAIDPDDVDWNDPAEVRQLLIRQRPGRGNALGTVKFLFPNEYDVYLHDTPSVSLFARDSRALSHGCVRVSEPAVLARYVLRDDPAWDDAKIEAARASGVEKHVKLGEPLPVHIVYFTAWVGDDGVLQTARDIYGYDAKQISLTSQDS